MEQPEMLRSPDYKHKCHAQKQCAPTVSALIIGISLQKQAEKNEKSQKQIICDSRVAFKTERVKIIPTYTGANPPS